MADHSGMKLGKLGKVETPGLLTMKAMLDGPTLPNPPATLSTENLVSNWPMLANDTHGDCTIAAALHIAQLWYALSGQTVIPDDGAALSAYTAATGFDPSDPATDKGAQEADILKFWKTVGFALNDTAPLDRLDGYASVNPRNVHELTSTIYALGAAYTGVMLPISAQTQDVWNVNPNDLEGDNAPGSWGGHAVPLVGYNADGPVCVTWGALKQMTWAWWGCYGEEAYAVLNRDMVNQAGLAGRGLDWNLLRSAMAAL